VVVSPPESLAEVGQADLIILEDTWERLTEDLRALRPDLGPARTLICTSPAMSLDLLRYIVGPGPQLLRAVVPLGGEPGEAVVAVAAEAGSSKETVARAGDALACLGSVEVVTEDSLDAFAAVVIGGVAFLSEALRGMEEGAVRDGLPRSTARAFADHTVLATALLLRDHAGSPADLKDQVASPGGTTIAALATLEDAGVRGAYLRAVQRTAVEVRGLRDTARTSMIGQ
jgi:pyrroline-5-carboxylate reductase